MNASFLEIKRLLTQDKLSKSDVVNLMTQLRICLESEKVKQEFHYLNMYCNWTVHPRLSQSAPAFKVLEFMADTLVSHPNAPGSPGFFRNMTKAFRFDEFQTDCQNFTVQYSLQDNFCTNTDIWHEFLKMLISILLERTLEFPELSKMKPGVLAIYNRIEQKFTQFFKNTKGIKRLSLILGEGERKNQVLWNIEFIPGPNCIPKTVILNGPLAVPK